MFEELVVGGRSLRRVLGGVLGMYSLGFNHNPMAKQDFTRQRSSLRYVYAGGVSPGRLPACLGAAATVTSCDFARRRRVGVCCRIGRGDGVLWGC